MKKIYKILLLTIVLTFLSTFNSHDFSPALKAKNSLFYIDKIEVKNNYLTNGNEIKKKLNNLYKKNIFTVKRKEIEDPLKEIDFLKKIEVKKKYPNTIIIKVIETKPVAILFKNQVKYLIDSSSNLVDFRGNDNFKNLPNIFGKNAETKFIFFLEQLKKNNFPNKKIKDYYYFQIGRWNLHLLNNKIIKLPYNNVEEAIIKSVELLDRKDFQNYKIIDLRVDGKIIVE